MKLSQEMRSCTAFGFYSPVPEVNSYLSYVNAAHKIPPPSREEGFYAISIQNWYQDRLALAETDKPDRTKSVFRSQLTEEYEGFIEGYVMGTGASAAGCRPGL